MPHRQQVWNKGHQQRGRLPQSMRPALRPPPPPSPPDLCPAPPPTSTSLWGRRRRQCRPLRLCRFLDTFRQRPNSRTRHSDRTPRAGRGRADVQPAGLGSRCISLRWKSCANKWRRIAVGGGGQGGMRGGGRGWEVWDSKICGPRWPDQIFPTVNFVFSHFCLGAGGPGGGPWGGGHPPPPTVF